MSVSSDEDLGETALKTVDIVALVKDPYELSRTQRCNICGLVATQDDIIVDTGLNLTMDIGKHIYNYYGSKCKFNDNGKHNHDMKGIRIHCAYICIYTVT